MRILNGIDIVEISKFKKAIQASNDNFLHRIFNPIEIEQNIESMAGKFAAKEAIIKCFGFPSDSWLNMQILKDQTGRPYFTIANIDLKVISSDLSISHTHENAVAMVSALIDEQI